jgi:hypothetical protein
VNLHATVTADAGSASVEGTVVFRVNGQPVAGVSATVSGASPASADSSIRLRKPILPLGAGMYALEATFVPGSSSPYATSSDSRNVAVKREGQRADGSVDTSAFPQYTGPTTIHHGDAPLLSMILHQSEGVEAGDVMYVPFDTLTVKAVFRIYRCNPTCASTPTWESGGQTLRSSLDWHTTGHGHASVRGPGTLSIGTYKLTVTIQPNGYISANTKSISIAVNGGSALFMRTPQAI